MTSPPPFPPSEDDCDLGDGYSEEDAEADRKAEAEFRERWDRALEKMATLDYASTTQRVRRPNGVGRMLRQMNEGEFAYGGKWRQPVQSAREIPISQLSLPERDSDQFNIPDQKAGEPLPPIVVLQLPWEPPVYRVLAGARVVEHCRKAGVASAKALVLHLDEQAVWLLVAWGLGSMPWPIDPLKPGLPE